MGRSKVAERLRTAVARGGTKGRNGSDGPVPGDREESILFAAPDVTEGDIEAVVEVLRSGWLTTGSESKMLEAELAETLGAEFVVSVSSCTAALEIAIAHLRLPPGARVGVPAWTFISSALSAHHNGLVPVLLDVEPDTLNLSPASLEAALAEGLDAVVVVHFGGVPVDAEVHRLCADAGVPVIEDAAHALGATDERGPIGGPGARAACFSFYATKNLTTAEGGALATNDPELAMFATAHRTHGMSVDSWARYGPGGGSYYEMLEPGIKANLPDILAALGRSQLRRFANTQTRRRLILNSYRELLEPSGVQFVPGRQVEGSADHLAVVLLPEGVQRGALIDRLRMRGIHPSVHFRPLHQFDWFSKHAPVGPSGLAVCDELAPRALSLPLHVGLSEADIERTSNAVLELCDLA